jgi:tetratricopeptide (TPR) repeat protein
MFNKKEYVFKSFLNLGEIYFLLGDIDNALNYFQGGLKYSQDDFHQYFQIKKNIANVYLDTGRNGEGKKTIDALLQNLRFKPLKCYEKKIEINLLLSKYFINIGEFKKSFERCRFNVKLVNNIPDTSKKEPIKGEIWNSLGRIYYLMGDYDNSLKYFKRALKFAESTNDVFKIAKINNNLGIIYKIKGNFSKAINSYEAFLKNSKQVGYKNGEAQIKYFKKALSISTSINDIQGIARISNNIGSLNMVMGKYKNALIYFKKYFDLSKKINYLKGVAIGSLNLGAVYLKLGNFKRSRYFLTLSGEYGKRMQMKELLVEYYLIFAQLELNEKGGESPKKVIELLEKGLNYAHSMRSNYYLILSYQRLGEFYFEINEYKLALKYFCRYLFLEKDEKDSQKTLNDIKIIRKKINFNTLDNEIKKDLKKLNLF